MIRIIAAYLPAKLHATWNLATWTSDDDILAEYLDAALRCYAAAEGVHALVRAYSLEQC